VNGHSITLVGAALLSCGGGMALVGCGGDDGPGATCGKVQPCGGDVVGDWELVANCQSHAAMAAFASGFADQAMSSDCPAQSLRGAELRAAGSFLLRADSSYAVSLQFNAILDINIPASCLTSSSCATVSANLQAEIAAGARPGVVSGSCAGSPDCLCREVLLLPQSEEGTYATAGTVLTFTATNGEVSTFDYCVQGNTAHFMNVSVGSAGQSTIDSDLVGVKP
jgi:hypothetical protein